MVAAPASAQGSYSPYDETASAALARYVRALADDTKDFNSLIGAGRAALALGDTQAAAGFFARADAVNPQSPLPQAGMGAVQAANGDAKAAMPGSWSRVSPFLQRLPSLAPAAKAAAVNLGIFPDSNGASYAYAAPQRTAPATVAMSQTVTTDRLAGIDALLQDPSPPPQAQPVWQQPPLPQARAKPVQVAYSAPPPRPATVQRTEPAEEPKIWLQLASGRDEGALSEQFGKLKSRYEELFKGITGYVAESGDRARLVIGPFRGTSDARIFSDDLHTVGVDSFRWTNSASDRIVPVAAE
jgi:hypothetical protein